MSTIMLAQASIILLCYSSCATADVYVSMADLLKLLNTEYQVINTISTHVYNQLPQPHRATDGDVLKRLLKLAEAYHRHMEYALDGEATFLHNPINVYLLMKNMIIGWQNLQYFMANSFYEKKLITLIEERRQQIGVHFPTADEDLAGAAQAFYLIQDTYRMSVADLASGKIVGTILPKDELTALDCFEIGKVASKSGDFYHAALWLQEAADRLPREATPTADFTEVQKALAHAQFQRSNVTGAIKIAEFLTTLNPDFEAAIGYFKDSAHAVKNNDPYNGRNNYTKLQSFTNALCRGDFLEKAPNASTDPLWCYYKRDHPYLLLAPLKVEIINWRPKVVIFRNIVSYAEMMTLKQLATNRLKRAEVFSAEKQTHLPTTKRTAKIAWIYTYDNDVAKRVNQRTGLATGLNMKTAEPMQIANYGIGGHYAPHHDWGKKAVEALNAGDRIATMLFYLIAPDVGGATVFPKLRLAVQPSTYDALFWFNIRKNGEPDLNVKHAACPVLGGFKWIANLWIHEYGNEFTRQCALNKDEYE